MALDCEGIAVRYVTHRGLRGATGESTSEGRRGLIFIVDVGVDV